MPASRASACGLMLGLLVLGGCAATGPSAPSHELHARAAVELVEVPFYPQERYQCGPAALAMMLDWSGAAVGPQALTAKLYIPARQGSLQPELAAQARQHQRLVYSIRGEPQALLDELAAGHPVLVLQNLALRWWPRWHYAVVIGYEPKRGELLLRSGTSKRHRVALSTFLHTWARGNNWGIVTLKPGRIPATAEPGPYLAAAFDLEAAGLPEQAATAYRAGIDRWPGHSGLRLALANLYYAAGRTMDAADVLQQGISAGAADGNVYNNLSLLLADLERWDEAEAAAQQAMQFGGPNSGLYRDTLAEICQRRPNGRCAAETRRKNWN